MYTIKFMKHNKNGFIAYNCRSYEVSYKPSGEANVRMVLIGDEGIYNEQVGADTPYEKAFAAVITEGKSQTVDVVKSKGRGRGEPKFEPEHGRD